MIWSYILSFDLDFTPGLFILSDWIGLVWIVASDQDRFMERYA